MPDFSSFGLKPTQSNSSDDINKVDLLSQLLEGSSDMFDELGRARVLESQMAQLNAHQTPSVLDRLLSPEGLVSLLGTGLAGALGGGAAAAGFGVGRLEATNAAVEAEKAQTRKAREELAEQHEKSLDRIDKSRQRFTTLLQAQPELFMNPETGEQTVSPKLLGFYALGEPIPLSPLTKESLEQATAAREKVHVALTERLENAASDDDARNIWRAIFTNLKAPMVDDATLESLVQAQGVGKLEEELANTIAARYPSVAAEVFIAAGDGKLKLWDPRISKMLIGKYEAPDDGDDDKVTVPDEFLRVGKMIAEYQMKPENRARIAQLRSEAATETEFSLALAKEALPLQPDYDIYKKNAGLMDPKDLDMTIKQFGEVKEDNAVADGIAGFEQLPARRALTPEQKDQADWATARKRVEAAKRAADKSQATNEIAVVAKQKVRLQTALNLGPRDAANMMKDLAVQAKTNATRPDGLVDQVRFEQELVKMVDAKINAKP